MAEDMWGTILSAIFFVIWCSFGGSKLNSFSIWWLDIWCSTDKGLGIYPTRTKYALFTPTLDRPASIIRPKRSMNLPNSIILTVKMGLWFYLFRETRLSVSKTDPGVIVASRKICEMIPLLSPSILYHRPLPLLRLWKILQVRFELCGTQDTTKLIICTPLLTWTTYVFNRIGVVRGLQNFKTWIINRGENLGWFWKIGDNTHLIVIVHIKLSQKIGLHNLTNRTRLKEGNC